MINRFFKNKILKASILLLILLLLLQFPNKNEYKLNTKVVINENNYHEIFLLDKNNYLAKTTVPVNNIKKIDLVDELLKDLKCSEENKNKLLNGFKCVIPSNLKIESKLEGNSTDINFSKEFNNYSDKTKELIIESIIFTMTSIEEIEKVNILVENNIYKKNLTRKYGINKKYALESVENINDVTVYYINKDEDKTYYIPVTKYTNSSEDKIKIIVEELSSKNSYETNLMSYLNYETKLINYNLSDDQIDLYFNEYLFDNINNKKVLEEVIYSISYSVQDTLNVSNIHFFVNNKEI